MSIHATPLNVHPVRAFSDNYIWLIDSPLAEGRLVAVDPGDAAPVLVELQRSGASWSHTTATLTDGTYVAQALQEDEAGARGESAPITFVVDTKAPVVSIDHVLTPIKDSTPTFTGHAGTLTGDHASVTVVISQGGSVINEAKAVSVIGGKWGYTAPSLADGDYTLQVSQRERGRHGARRVRGRHQRPKTLDQADDGADQQRDTDARGQRRRTLAG